MSLSRRSFYCSGTAALLATLQARSAFADILLPAQIRLVVGFPAGGPVDIAGRLAADRLSARLATKIAVDNLAGDSGNNATRAVVRAEPDGSTVLVCGPVHPINDLLFKNLDFSFARDIQPVIGLYSVPLVVEVGPAVAVRTAQEFIDEAKARPGRLKVGYAGKGTPQHIGIALFAFMAGVEFTLVPFAGSPPALDALLAGEVDAMFDPLPSSLGHIRSGRLKALAVTGATRSDALPTVPAMVEMLPGYTAGSWFGLGVPRRTPADKVERLNAVLDADLATPETAARIRALGGTVMGGSSTDFVDFIAAETARYGDVIRRANITAG